MSYYTGLQDYVDAVAKHEEEKRKGAKKRYPQLQLSVPAQVGSLCRKLQLDNLSLDVNMRYALVKKNVAFLLFGKYNFQTASNASPNVG